MKDWQGLLLRSFLKVRQCGALMKAEAEARLSGFESSVPLFSHL